MSHASATATATARPRPAAGAPDALTRPLVVVTGKGGVGKSTVAAALGVLAARRGRRALVVEVAAREDVRRALTGRTGGAHVVRRIAPGLHHLSIDPGGALAEYLREQLPVRPLAALLVHDRTFGLLAAAAPGLAELVTIGKVWRLAQRALPGRRYDVVILDAPSTGHVVGLLGAPRAFAGVALRGPVAGQAARIDAFLTDPRQTAVVAVAAPEEMAVTEAVALRDRLAADVGIAVAGYVVDGLVEDRLSPGELRAVAAAPPGRARHAALFAASLAARHREQVRRLADAVAPMPVQTLPLLYTAALGPPELRRLATLLGRA